MARGLPDLSRRCPRCLFPPEACLCPDVRPVRPRTRVVLLRHASELRRPSNTGRWAALALEGARVVDYALPGLPPDLSALREPGTVLLFPSPHPSARLVLPPRQLVVVDATWAQARRMVQRIPELRTLPRLGLSLPPDPRRAPMRRPTVTGGLSTICALAAALQQVGDREAGRALSALADLALDRGWLLRAGEVSGRGVRRAQGG